ncbi:lysophospholipid acyltransferase family protein [Jiulongibacter sp. NS-SX5]|uniref:lysophospholipid acyltransferase family protein n=1 Tax=Jiulongibacter sp. NS-SX5 TaxID=3463854 RepID=UPI0040582399
MKAIAYYLSLPFIFGFSLLPFSIHYFLSDVLVFPVLFHLVGYRRKVVQKNLHNAFPEKTESELDSIEKEFYHYLSDLFVETVKFFTIRCRVLKERFKYINPEVTDDWFLDQRSFVLTLGHYGNYEWLAKTLDISFNHRGTGPYREMSNQYFDKLFLRARSRYGTMLYPTYKTMETLRKEHEEVYLVALANDQSAPADKAYWTTFLNQDTSFFVGTEKIARAFNMPVLFAKIERVKRGYYEVRFEVISENPVEEPEGAIMEKHAQLLEEQIKAKPAYWLWTHKRWKHEKPAGVTKGFSAKVPA